MSSTLQLAMKALLTIQLPFCEGEEPIGPAILRQKELLALLTQRRLFERVRLGRDEDVAETAPLAQVAADHTGVGTAMLLAIDLPVAGRRSLP
jgi:hypothetical protein